MARKLDLSGLTPEDALPKLKSLPSDEDRADVILLFAIVFASPEIEALSRRMTCVGTETVEAEIDLTPRLRDLHAVLAEFDEGKRRRAEAQRRHTKPKRIFIIKRPWWSDPEFGDGSDAGPSA